ncbi:MAG: hypothetical protein KDE29_19555 [Anaerolineales bacterium]|nr:hypothetical protein [Anaerolineales bacterium]
MIRLILLRLLESYFRHRWLYLLPIVLMSALALLSVLNARPKYQADGVLYVQADSLLSSLTDVRANSASWWVTPAQATMGDLNELLQTDAFIRSVIRPTKLEAEMDQGPDVVNNILQETRKNIWVYPVGDNHLQVVATSEDPQVAFELVNATVEGYLQWQINAKRADSQTAQSFFEDVIQTYETELADARDAMRVYLEAHPEPVRGTRSGIEQLEVTRLQSAIDLAASRYASALDKEENTRLAMAQIESEMRQSYLLIDAPILPDRPVVSLRQTAVNMAIFVAVGVVISGGAIVGGALLDRSFRFPVDVVSRLELPVLTIVPDTTPKMKRRWLRRRAPAGAGAAAGSTTPAGRPAYTAALVAESEPYDAPQQVDPVH